MHRIRVARYKTIDSRSSYLMLLALNACPSTQHTHTHTQQPYLMLLGCSIACGYTCIYTDNNNIIFIYLASHYYYHHHHIIMYNNNNDNSFSSDHRNVNINMSPRISFSNDFLESSSNNNHNLNTHSRLTPLPPAVSSDFEFSVSNHSMMSADELFSQGRLLPFKNNSQQKRVSTIREELLTEDDNGGGGGSGANKPPKSGRWKGLLGLRKSHATSRKQQQQQPDYNRSAFLPHENPQNFTGNSE